ncbi:MAG: hypothetical protein H7Y06_06695, partial [Opitutaceae bacterium]|nr:hypothetical protein [Opitutaceae bacterium]
FHVGLDEVFELGRCPRCKGAKNADLLGDWILKLHGHVAGKLGLEMWMWADRLLEHAAMPYTEHEASVNETWQCLDRLPKDLVLCDWHYDRSKGFPSTAFLLDKGFRVLSCPWVDEVSGRAFLESAHEAAAQERKGGGKWSGFLQTTWCDSTQLATILLEKKENEKVSGVFDKDIPYYVARMMRKGMPAGYVGDFARAAPPA